jgi:hypothetical protein
MVNPMLLKEVSRTIEELATIIARLQFVMAELQKAQRQESQRPRSRLHQKSHNLELDIREGAAQPEARPLQRWASLGKMAEGVEVVSRILNRRAFQSWFKTAIQDLAIRVRSRWLDSKGG